MAMWSTKPRPADLSEWEVDERAERRRHAVWLVMHGASIGVVAHECGVTRNTLDGWVKTERRRRRAVA